MKESVVYSILALLCFSLWGIFGKLSTFYLKAQHAIVYEALGFMMVVVWILVKYNFKLEVNIEGIVYAVLVGVTGLAGTLLFLLAINKGHTAIVTFITALYPGAVLAFSYIVLKEPISFQQWIAIILALASLILFALG